LPRLDARKRQKLTPIDGLPPDLIGMSPGCSFYPRCSYHIQRCLEENPQLREARPGHEVACWVDVDGGRS